MTSLAVFFLFLSFLAQHRQRSDIFPLNHRCARHASRLPVACVLALVLVLCAGVASRSAERTHHHKRGSTQRATVREPTLHGGALVHTLHTVASGRCRAPRRDARVATLVCERDGVLRVRVRGGPLAAAAVARDYAQSTLLVPDCALFNADATVAGDAVARVVVRLPDAGANELRFGVAPADALDCFDSFDLSVRHEAPRGERDEHAYVAALAAHEERRRTAADNATAAGAVDFRRTWHAAAISINANDGADNFLTQVILLLPFSSFV